MKTETQMKAEEVDNWYEWLVKRIPALDNLTAEGYIKLALKQYATQQTKELFTKEDMISFAVWYNDKPYAECRNKTLDDLFNEYKKK